MKLSVKKGFIDKDTNIFHNVGEIIEYPEKRAKEIETKGFGKILNEPKPTKAEPKSEKVEEPMEIEKPKKVARKK
jgi:hypothetical protein